MNKEYTLEQIADLIVKGELIMFSLCGSLSVEDRKQVRKLAMERGAKKLPNALFWHPETGERLE